MRRASALFFLGRLKMQQNDLAAAERNLREALRLQEELHGTAHRLTARTRYQLGHILLLQNRPEAVAELKAATEQLIQRAGERVEATTSSMSVLALALEAQGDPAEAESWHRRAIDLARRNGTPFSLARFGQRYGCFLVKQGRLEEALAAYREAVEAAEKLFAQTRGLPEELREGVIGQFLQIYRELTSLLLRLHQQKPADGYDREAFTVTALTQSRIFSEMLRQAQVSEYAQSEHFRALKAQRDRRLDRLAAMRQGNGVEASLDDGEDESASPAAAGEPRGEAELAMALDRMEEALLRDRTAIFVMTRNRFEAVLLTPGRDGVTKRIRELRGPIEAVAVTGELGSLRDLDPAKLHDLYRQLFLQLGMLVGRYGEEERRRFAATRDAGALLAEYAELPYLGERYRIGYLPSASALAALRESAPAQTLRRAAGGLRPPCFGGQRRLARGLARRRGRRCRPGRRTAGAARHSDAFRRPAAVASASLLLGLFRVRRRLSVGMHAHPLPV
ncbi:MAG TPA: tetratricopeptide repeat protein [Candidatus Desulfobacillus denitrificans]|nr:tetratricopeptide repeat protein [Candidatus Desulfobacillus denitrificans]HNT62881.1 tetratricopeptide repeat protein [Candidatus Desulfobacillus denitrificans]